MHILIVEDDPVVADVLGMTLEEAGHFPSIAHTIEVALAELRHNDMTLFCWTSTSLMGMEQGWRG